jgi:hypothetical protein
MTSSMKEDRAGKKIEVLMDYERQPSDLKIVLLA